MKAALFRGKGQHVDGDIDSRAVGLPFFISNDELRDNEFQMLQARELMRWKERKSVKIEFANRETVSNSSGEVVGRGKKDTPTCDASSSVIPPQITVAKSSSREGLGITVAEHGPSWALIASKLVGGIARRGVTFGGSKSKRS